MCGATPSSIIEMREGKDDQIQEVVSKLANAFLYINGCIPAAVRVDLRLPAVVPAKQLALTKSYVNTYNVVLL